MQKIKIFLAASVELENDIIRLGDSIRHKNNLLVGKGIYYELDTWRDHSSRLIKEGLQSEYNETVKDGDVFLLLAHTKVGKFTAFEFDNALHSYLETGTPYIFTFFKKTDGSISDGSLNEFREKLIQLNHYLTSYSEYNDLWVLIDKELDNLIENAPQFSLLSYPKRFNGHLIRHLFEAMSGIDPEVGTALAKLNQTNPEWQFDDNYSEDVKAIIKEKFVGALGGQIGQLLAIGNDEDMLNKSRYYISQCRVITMIALQLVSFSLLSSLWNEAIAKDPGKSTLSEKGTDVLRGFFEGRELTLLQQIELIDTLLNLFEANKLALPLPELKTIRNEFQSNSELSIVINHLEKLNSSNNNSYTSCFQAEKYLSIVLEKLIFFTEYSMISITTVHYESIYERHAGFYHSYANIDSKVSQDLKQKELKYFPSPISNHSVFLYKGLYTDESTRINLFPFVINLHSLTFDSGQKVCFFSQKLGIRHILRYRFVETGQTETIAYKKLLANNPSQLSLEELNKIIVNIDKRKQLNLDNTFRLFANAARLLAGIDFGLEDNDIFDL